jgi:hypothetical protein
MTTHLTSDGKRILSPEKPALPPTKPPRSIVPIQSSPTLALAPGSLERAGVAPTPAPLLHASSLRSCHRHTLLVASNWVPSILCIDSRTALEETFSCGRIGRARTYNTEIAPLACRRSSLVTSIGFDPAVKAVTTAAIVQLRAFLVIGGGVAWVKGRKGSCWSVAEVRSSARIGGNKHTRSLVRGAPLR